MFNDGANDGAWRFQLRDRLGKWVKMYGPVKFDVQLPGVKNKSIGYGLFVGSDRYGWSKIKVDDNKNIPKGTYEVENKYITGVKAVIGLNPTKPEPKKKPAVAPAKQQSPAVAGEITDLQDKALDWYTNIGFDYTNRYLRQGLDISPKQKQYTEVLIDLINSTSLPSATTLYRGRPISNEERARVIDQLKVGDIMEDKGIGSTSESKEQAIFFANMDLDYKDEVKVKRRALLKITVPEGARGFKIPKGYSQYEEQEVLLPPNSKFKVTEVEEIDGVKHISVDLIIDERAN